MHAHMSDLHIVTTQTAKMFMSSKGKSRGRNHSTKPREQNCFEKLKLV